MKCNGVAEVPIGEVKRKVSVICENPVLNIVAKDRYSLKEQLAAVKPLVLDNPF